jgi:hypothetical protein
VIKDKEPTTGELSAEVSAVPPVAANRVVAILAFLAGTWLAAGSVGLLAHPLRKVLTLLALALAVVVLRPGIQRKISSIVILLGASVLFVYLFISSSIVLNVMAVCLVPAIFALVSAGREKKLLNILSAAVAIFGLYRLAYSSIPTVWMAADGLGKLLGSLGTLVTQKPVFTGASFAGLDYIVLMSILWILYLAGSPKPRITRALYGFAGIFVGQMCYLIVLSFAPDILALVPRPTTTDSWSWAGVFHKTIPWNLPLIACAFQLLTAACMFRWTSLSANVSADNEQAKRNNFIPVIAILVLAVTMPAASVLFPARLSLDGKKIVFYEKGFLNWLKPEHGQYGRLASGMYGMLPAYIESLGGTPLISKELSQQDLSNADALVLLFPDEPWTQGQLERIWEFVRSGGSLLVMGEHTTVDSAGKNRFNEVLAPTAIRVEFDCGTYAVGGWLQSYDALSHPATAGVQDDRNQFGVVIGASLRTNWPARPILVGKFGWSDAGDRGSSQAMMGNGIYDGGEKLGDVVLAAEQPLGKGRVIAFGDTSSLTNGINVGSYVFTSRLFGYLAGDEKDAQPMWRQFVGIIIWILLTTLLFYKPQQRNIFVVILCLSASLAFCNVVSQKAGMIYPDGSHKKPNNLAYVDSSHLEGYSGESWRPDGVGGLMLTLMRNGYLALSLSDLSAERLAGAGLFISIAPSREFSAKEREIIKDYVFKGGSVIITAGYDEAGPVSSLLSQFGFTIGPAGRSEPEPVAMGHFKSPYLAANNKQVFVRFYAGWPVSCNDPNARIIAYGKNNLPIIIMRSFGAGKVTVIGDTCFAMNKNLEWESGEAFEGMRENADFWRWFITQLDQKKPQWIPPALQGDPNSVRKDPNSAGIP